MAVDMFIKIGDIKGEAQDKKHADEIDVLAWSWGAAQSGTTHLGAGSGSGKVAVQDLTITKYVDKSTPNLLDRLFTGKHIDSALLSIRKAGGEQQDFLKIKMTNVIVTSLSTGGSGADDRFTETIVLNFGKVSVDYCTQKKDGTLDAAINFAYDISTNTKGG